MPSAVVEWPILIEYLIAVLGNATGSNADYNHATYSCEFGRSCATGETNPYVKT